MVDERGQLVAKRRISDDLTGFRVLVERLAEHGDQAEDPIPVAIETSRGLLVARLRATGRPVYAINPLAVSRYRERRTTTRANSDHADAVVLANILRTDAGAHRRLPANQDAAWNRQQIANQLRSLRGEYFPAALAAFRHRPWLPRSPSHSCAHC